MPQKIYDNRRIHSLDNSGWKEVVPESPDSERWVRCYRELDECSMEPHIRIGYYNRIIHGYIVRWPVGDTSTGVTCSTWFDNEDEARSFMVGKMLYYV